MAAAYAALVSLMNIMEQIQSHPRLWISFDKKQIESLGEKVGFLLDFLESSSSHGGRSKEAQVLERQIASAAHAAEDVLESHVVDLILAGSTTSSILKGIKSLINRSNLSLDLHKVIKSMDSVKKKVGERTHQLSEGIDFVQPAYLLPSTSSRPLTTDKKPMIGFDDKLLNLMDQLTGQRSNRQIIPIVGMGGIGKTTLARQVYENLAIVQHFDIRAWVTVSQAYSVREVLLKLLSSQTKSTHETDQETEDRLGERLYKSLSGRRYLMVLDDVWSIEIWDKIKLFFPDNNSSSRIVVTTRLSNVATYFGPSYISIDVLDEKKSWNLFCRMAFDREVCPPELEEIGKKIVKKCKGLPLSIVVIAGLLGKFSMTQEYWENVAEDVNSFLSSGGNEQCLDILSLSYNHLPVHLKPCFLYIGVFPEDHEIRASQLIRLWVAEGFIKPNKSQSLERIAEGYLKDLVDRNLISVCRLGSSGKIKSCSIHDLLRDFGLKIAVKQKFLYIMRPFDLPRVTETERRLIYHEKLFNDIALQSAKLVRSLICINNGDLPSFMFRLLRVLNGVERDSLEATLQQVNLRYLACRLNFWVLKDPDVLPWSISLLWNVQSLIITGGNYKRVVAPPEIWEMHQLRHIKFDSIGLPDPPPSDQEDGVVLQNLQTLKRVANFRWSEEACKRIPNVLKLHITRDYAKNENSNTFDTSYVSYDLHNLGRLHKLESLWCSFLLRPYGSDLLQNLTFPTSLQKLSLSDSDLQWEELTMIGSLPHLEVLKLESRSARGPKWDPVEGDFLRLKYLKIAHCTSLIHWNADSSSFPVLENLVLEELDKLDEIPSGIGDIPTLGRITVHDCSVSAAISAMRILDQQESLGNEGLHVQIKVVPRDVESFKEQVEQESFKH